MRFAMRYHRSRLFFLRNQITIQWYGLFFLYVFGIALWLLINSNLSNFAKRLEEGQKGQTCILLIKPENRTKKNVTDCVQKNRSNNGDFKFNGDDSTDSGASPKATATESSNEPSTPLAPIQPIPTSPAPSEPTPVLTVPTPDILPPVKKVIPVVPDTLELITR